MTYNIKIGDLITAAAISSPFDAINNDKLSDEVYTMMEQNNYDIYGLRDQDNNVFGYIDKTGRVNGFDVSRIISSDTPLHLVFEKLLVNDFLFVLVKDKVKDLITIADVQKFPSRAFIFSAINQFEMEITDILRGNIKEEEIVDLLSQNRFYKAKKLLDEKVEVNMDIDIFECLEISDKINIYFKRFEYKQLGFSSRKKMRSYINKLIDIRNSVAHGNDFLKKFGRAETMECILRALDLSEKIRETRLGVNLD